MFVLIRWPKSFLPSRQHKPVAKVCCCWAGREVLGLEHICIGRRYPMMFALEWVGGKRNPAALLFGVVGPPIDHCSGSPKISQSDNHLFECAHRGTLRWKRCNYFVLPH